MRETREARARMGGDDPVQQGAEGAVRPHPRGRRLRTFQTFPGLLLERGGSVWHSAGKVVCIRRFLQWPESGQCGGHDRHWAVHHPSCGGHQGFGRGRHRRFPAFHLRRHGAPVAMMPGKRVFLSLFLPALIIRCNFAGNF